MDLLVLPDGTVRAIYAEDIDLTRTSAPPSSAGPAMSSRIPTGGGSPTWARSAARSSDRSTGEARRWPPKLQWLEANWLMASG